MSRNILILGASYGSLLATKLAMAGHNVTMTCREATAARINAAGTIVRIKLRGEDTHRALPSGALPGSVRAITPTNVDPTRFDLVCLAMQEPQYRAPEIAWLMRQIALSGKPCLSIMNMPPLPYLMRLPGLQTSMLRAAYSCPEVWDGFQPGLVSLCSPDPQAFRPPEEAANVLHVGLPTNFKAVPFEDPQHTALLQELADDIEAVRIDGKEVPVKLRVHDSLFVPLAKWSMLLTGNYRCVTADEPRSIRDAVHGDLALSADVYAWVGHLARRLGADPSDQVPFEKYAKAAEALMKPSSAARAIEAGAAQIERVDRLVRTIGASMGTWHQEVDRVVDQVDARLHLTARSIA
ncbi:hypothetical protein AIOL_003610 [Candidatus Rhodobacter oscarellae]|uniref:Ketopantoate reductase N-terminal domain-containing protein n=1 Tax=Candidatus Rhodobacter oscarellae TaxID=1675527 RepID=A0A0J9E7G0_9RHOB|nr:acetyl-CoA carboxylase [Candidatus Rhodobacter lobularis]KMW58632.1 hypothetical protein AIOL_003610 [Candidatus Rhodobacter lobularis]